jgi:hypothetical protein
MAPGTAILSLPIVPLSSEHGRMTPFQRFLLRLRRRFFRGYELLMFAALLALAATALLPARADPARPASQCGNNHMSPTVMHR